MGSSRFDKMAVANRLPTRKITASEEKAGKKCMICHEEYCEGQMVKTLPCIHFFHTKCIDPWLAQKDTCPECRHNVGCNEVKDKNAQQQEDRDARIARLLNELDHYDEDDDDDEEEENKATEENVQEDNEQAIIQRLVYGDL